MLSALRHRAAELGDQAVHLRCGTYAEALDRLGEPVELCQPTSRMALALGYSRRDVTVLPARGFLTAREDFAAWADAQRNQLRFADFYRFARVRHRVLMDGDRPAGGRYVVDTGNGVPPPRGATRLNVPAPPNLVEDEIDERVRHDLDRWEREGIRFTGRDGPRRFPATREEALGRLRHFVRYRLPAFGRYDQAMLAGDPYLAHSLLSSSLNLGLLDPMEVVSRAERAYRSGRTSLSSVEAFCRQVVGWRDYAWHLYWYFRPEEDPEPNLLRADRPMPDWFHDLDAEAVQARCLRAALAGVRDRGYVHQVQRLMVLGNYAIQRGWRPDQLIEWFHRNFIDGYTWAMAGNVVGMSPYADLGLMSARPYVAPGTYIDRMSDHCGGCRYDPKLRLGERACPYTGGYWAVLARGGDALSVNPRIRQALAHRDPLPDLEAVVAAEEARGDGPP